MTILAARAGSIAIGLLAGVGLAAAQELEPIRYVVSFPEPQTHYMKVEATVPVPEGQPVELMMAVWTPGSYLVREYARHVEAFTARDGRGRPLSVEKTQKNRWRVAASTTPTVTISYGVYAREMSVRTNWVDDRFALINGAPTFVTLTDGHPRPHEVRLVLPPGWGQSLTGLPAAPGGRSHHYRAPDFDTLVDSPLVVGNPAVHEFEVAGKPHYLVNVGELDIWDGAQAAIDLEKIVREAFAMWRHLPYDRYLFLNLITESTGGLEHKNSTVLMTSRWSTRMRSAYLRWLSTAAHEIFHAWNIKLLRPIELGPFDYENENYTENLWIAEGMTEYYSDLILHRTGLTSQPELLGALSSNITQLQSTPGRLVQSVDHASFDAWIKYYRQDENSDNTSVSYYTKGAVIAFLLDARIRRATAGTRRLDDLMRAAYERYSGQQGYTTEEFTALVDDVAGTQAGMGAWLDMVVSSTEELAYRDALDWFGLAFRDPASASQAWLGVSTRRDEGRLLITEVPRDSPALAAGINVDDEIVAMDGYRVRAGQLENRLAQQRPGDRISLLVARRGEMRRFDVTLGSAPRRRWTVEVAANATREQQERLRDW